MVKVFVLELKGMDQKSIHNHLGKMPVLANLLNTDLSHGFTVALVAQKHGWTEPMVWFLALKGKDDQDRFKALGWGRGDTGYLPCFRSQVLGL